MAWLAVPLYLTGSFLLVNKCQLCFNYIIHYLIIFILIVLYLLYLIWQFRNREIADKYVIACTNILTNYFNEDYQINFAPVFCINCYWPRTFIDELLNVERNYPWRGRFPELIVYLRSLTWTGFLLYLILKNNLFKFTIIFLAIPVILSIASYWRLSSPFKKCII